MKRFLKNAAVFASLAFCGLFILSNDAFAVGGYYGFSQDSITLAPGNTGSVTTVAAPNDAGRRVSAGDAVFSGVNNDCVSASFAPIGYGSWGTGGSINVNNVNTPGTLEIGTVSISAKNVSVSCSATVTISGELMDHQDGTSRSSATLTIYVVAPEPTPASSDNQITGLTPSAGTASGSGSNWTISDVPRDAASITLTPSLPAGASVSGGSPVTCALSGNSSACSRDTSCNLCYRWRRIADDCGYDSCQYELPKHRNIFPEAAALRARFLSDALPHRWSHREQRIGSDERQDWVRSPGSLTGYNGIPDRLFQVNSRRMISGLFRLFSVRRRCNRLPCPR